MGMLDKLKFEIKYLLALPRYLAVKKRLGVHIMSIDDTLDYMAIPGNCVVRFGDGEFALLDGGDIFKYQKHSHTLQQELAKAVSCTDKPNVLVCMPEPLCGLEPYIRRSQKMWTINIAKNHQVYKKFCDPKILYGNSFVSRPYMIYRDKKEAGHCFEKLISIFKDKDIVLIEGEYSRSGVGNDLFAQARSVRRILCPAVNAFDRYDAILQQAEKLERNCLILLAIGPASKPIVTELARQGYWALDIGHIDSEYEWYLSGAEKKQHNTAKHTAEIVDENIGDCEDADYQNSIICNLAR